MFPWLVDHGKSNSCTQLHLGSGVPRKNQWWVDNHEVHGLEVDGPFVGDSQFAVRFKMDVTAKASGQRMQMTEVGVYTVKNDKIVREEFYYNAP